MGSTLGWTYLAAGQNDQAYEQAKKTFDLEPNHPIGRWMLSQTYIVTGKYQEALALDEPWLERDPTNQFALRDAGVAYAKVGRRDKAEEMIRRFRELAKTQFVSTCKIAAIYVALDDKEKAFEELNRSFEIRDWELYRLNVDTYWIPLHGDPRFEALVKRLNLPK
jgi:predicted Zn-dependent protease